MDDKPKLKNTAGTPKTTFADFFTLQPIEFLSPLPLQECIRRITRKASSRSKTDTALTAQVWLSAPGGSAYDFLLIRQSRQAEKRQQNNFWNSPVRIDGTLKYWDENSTLVTCRPRFDGSFVAMMILLGAFLLLLFLPSSAAGWGEFSIVLFFCVAGCGLLALFHRMSQVDEHRRLIALVEDMLRYPITIEGSTVKHHEVDEYGIPIDTAYDAPDWTNLDWLNPPQDSSTQK